MSSQSLSAHETNEYIDLYRFRSEGVLLLSRSKSVAM